MSNFFSRLLENVLGSSKAWWLEIKTSQPSCTYYFGPFDSEAEAETLKGGYIEDLEQEGAQSIRFSLHHCNVPDTLTIVDEADGPLGGFSTPAFSSQP
jgi:hypothetical protein